jgi:hypothetical protein
MALGFKISTHRSNDNLHISLSGNFDGEAAHQLLNILQGNPSGVSNVFVNTENLDRIYASGKKAFQERIDLIVEQSVDLFFTGENAERMVPSSYMMGAGG